MTKREVINQILRETVVQLADAGCPWPPKGGQHHNGPVRGAIIKNDEWGFEIYCSSHHSFVENSQLARTLFELYLEEVIQPNTYLYEQG